MKHDHRHTKKQTPADRTSSRERDDARGEPGRERQSRIGAAQLAAPSARTWRRAGRFSSSGS